MLRSTHRIITTHAGSLARPADLREMWANAQTPEDALRKRLAAAVGQVVDEQLRLGVDVPNDGEFGKPMRAASDLAAWGTYIFGRLSGFGPAPEALRAPRRTKPGEAMRIVIERWEMREFAQYYADLGTAFGAPRPAAIGPIAYTGHDALARDLENLKAATAARGVKEAFVTSISPGSIEVFCRGQNAHYASSEAFLEALADAMHVEYKAIVDAGFVLQLDDPGLPDAWDMLDPTPSVADYQRYAMLRVEALNRALRGIPEDRVRFHMCWGSWHGPHTTDIPLADIVEVMLKVKAQAYSIEAGNVRHEHEHKVWKKVKLPAGRILVPGVVSHATNVVEHPELVADRICAYADAVGRENVIAGTDCGLGGRVHEEIAAAKLAALAEGAKLATKRLWG